MNSSSPLPLARHLTIAAALMAASSPVDASVVGPYQPDADTVILLHLDEDGSGGLAINSAPGGANFVATANPTAATPRQPIPGLLGAPGAIGLGFDFGRCANLSFSNTLALFMDANDNGVANLDVNGTTPGADAISGSQLVGANGAFTFEALVSFPSLTGGNREIFAMDNSGGAGARPFQFRVTAAGLLEFNNIAVAGANPRVALPTTGPDAFVPNQWFHVAMTYNGSGGITFYWTKLDNTRTAASVLFATNVPNVLNLSGSAVFTVGNENRGASGEGLTGRIDEVRISKVARAATGMAFDASAPPIPPGIDPQPTDQFVGVGETLVIDSHASGSAPLAFRWQQNSPGGWADLAGETGESLRLPVVFTTEGEYRYIVANTYGAITSRVVRVTVGALFTGLHPTGFNDDGVMLPDGAVDPHYQIWASADIANLGPRTIAVANTLDYNANDGGSRWIAPTPSLGGVRGSYTYRTTFLLDSALAEGATLTASVLSGGSLRVLLNGQSTGVANLTPAFPGPHRIALSFTLTNGFVPGANTLDFIVDNAAGVPNAPGGNAFRVMSIRGIGPARPPGLTLLQQPRSQTVREGGRVTFDCVALGRPPLRYQWFGDDEPITDATNRTLTYNPVTAFGQPTILRVQVSSDEQSVDSDSVELGVVFDNQPVVAESPSLAGISGFELRLPVSALIQNATDPDGDQILFSGFDSVGVNAEQPGGIRLAGSTLIYTNVPGFAGSDEFTVVLSDSGGSTTLVTVYVEMTPAALRAELRPDGQVLIAWPLAATTAGFRLLTGGQPAAISTPVTDGILTNGSESWLLRPAGGPPAFFRLVYP